MLRLQNLTIEPNSQAFDHNFESKKTTVVLGQNNSGKTNLLRFIAGLSTPAQGTLFLEAKDITFTKPQQRPVALVVQNFVNYPNWSVEQNILSPLRGKKISKLDQKKRAHELAETLGLEGLLSRLPSELSGGQQQRLAIARALAQDASVLLLDEPFVNLDYKLREAITLELRDLLKTNETTVIYATSNPRDAFAMGDEILLLNNRTKLQGGAILPVYLSPETIEAANLMSDPQTNIVNFHDKQKQTDPVCAVRPEHVYLESEASSGEIKNFEFRISGSETSGDETILHGSVQDFAWVIRRPGMIDIPNREILKVFVHKCDLLDFPPKHQ